MKTIIIITFLTLFTAGFYFYPDYARNYSSIIRLNTDSTEKTLPKNFRIVNQTTSGSSQFTESQLQLILEKLESKNIWIVDLREESHGFLNGIPISTYRDKNDLNKGKSIEEIIKDEEEKERLLSQKILAVLYKKHGRSPFFYLVREVSSSEKTVKKQGAHYIRFPTRDYTHPKDHIVDAFISFIKNLDPQAKLHFHCSAGKGRTTTFLAMYEIMKNPELTLEEIVHKQKSLGGIDLLMDPDPTKWKAQAAYERREFIKNFYRFSRENPDFTLSWSEWIKGQSKIEI